MREILFRGKRTENDEWVFGDLRHIFYGECYPHIVDNSNGLNNSVCGLEVDPATVGQFTGLTDRNGVKIFGGDIVAVKVYNSSIFENYKVVWFVGNGGFHLFRPKREKMDVGWDAKRGEIGYGTDLNDLVIRQRMVEVIGNVHDNPELLTEWLGKKCKE